MTRTPGARTRLYHRQPRARDRAWTAMRVQRRFTLPDLIATAEASEANVGTYVRGLARAGYLRAAQPKRNGHKGGHIVWALTRDTGPLAPRLQSDGRTFDPNLRQVFEGGLRQC